MTRWDRPEFMMPDTFPVEDVAQLDGLRSWSWREFLEPSWRQGCLRRPAQRRTSAVPA